jgi:hypothetical protein
LAEDEPDVVRYAALLRGTESAWQALSYGLTSLTVFGQVGGVYLNFGLWAISIFPAWLVLRHFGADGTQLEKGQPTKSVQVAESRETTSGDEVDRVNSKEV